MEPSTINIHSPSAAPAYKTPPDGAFAALAEAPPPQPMPMHKTVRGKQKPLNLTDYFMDPLLSAAVRQFNISYHLVPLETRVEMKGAIADRLKQLGASDEAMRTHMTTIIKEAGGNAHAYTWRQKQEIPAPMHLQQQMPITSLPDAFTALAEAPPPHKSFYGAHKLDFYLKYDPLLSAAVAAFVDTSQHVSPRESAQMQQLMSNRLQAWGAGAIRSATFIKNILQTQQQSHTYTR